MRSSVCALRRLVQKKYESGCRDRSGFHSGPAWRSKRRRAFSCGPLLRSEPLFNAGSEVEHLPTNSRGWRPAAIELPIDQGLFSVADLLGQHLAGDVILK